MRGAMLSIFFIVTITIQVLHVEAGECGGPGEAKCPNNRPSTKSPVPPTTTTQVPPTTTSTASPPTITKSPPTTPPPTGSKDFNCSGWLMKGYGYMVHRNVEIVNYYTATELCAEYGAKLPHHNIRTIKGRRRLMRQLDIKQNFFHFGMTDRQVETEWRWLDGSIVDQEQLGWHELEPNNQNTENCAISWYKGHHNFFLPVNDIPCDYETHYDNYVWRINWKEYRFLPVVVCEKKCK